MRNFRKNSNDRPFKKSFKGNNRRNNQSFYRRKYSRDNQNGNTSQHKPFSRRFGFKKNQNGKFRSFRTGKKRFEQRKGESFQNKLDRQLEDYKNGREVSSNRATQRLDNALDTYFQRGSTTRENRMDQALENYWKQGNE